LSIQNLIEKKLVEREISFTDLPSTFNLHPQIYLINTDWWERERENEMEI
jgi:hypothetical protein